MPDLKTQNRLLFKRVAQKCFSDDIDGSEWKLWITSDLTGTLIARAQEEPTAACGGQAKTLEELYGGIRDSQEDKGAKSLYASGKRWKSEYGEALPEKVSAIDERTRLHFHRGGPLFEVHLP